MTSLPFERTLLDALHSITILPRRLVFCTPGLEPTVPLLRGVWGNALHSIDRNAYDNVFFPGENGGLPGYVLREAGTDPHGFPMVDHILIGQAISHDGALLAAWIRACELGLGPDRIPFFLRGHVLGPDDSQPDTAAPWNLSNAPWPLSGSPVTSPCRFVFQNPLRLLKDGKLISAPTFVDLVVALCRRIGNFLPAELTQDWREISHLALETARRLPCLPWQGEAHNLVRWSSSQHAELNMRGVSGFLDLPFGPGALWPLIAAGRWIHLGKGTVMGMGRPWLEPLKDESHGFPQLE